MLFKIDYDTVNIKANHIYQNRARARVYILCLCLVAPRHHGSGYGNPLPEVQVQVQENQSNQPSDANTFIQPIGKKAKSRAAFPLSTATGLVPCLQ